MTATQSYLLKALLAEVSNIKDRTERLTMIANIKGELNTLEVKTLRQRVKKENIT